LGIASWSPGTTSEANTLRDTLVLVPAGTHYCGTAKDCSVVKLPTMLFSHSSSRTSRQQRQSVSHDRRRRLIPIAEARGLHAEEMMNGGEWWCGSFARTTLLPLSFLHFISACPRVSYGL
jgi:hypothetical protein